jgi:phage FluMu protein Com
MAIEFHCNFCGKLVKAPEEAGGKKGKCPSCQNILYVPMADGTVDEFDLAPVDENEERKRRQMEEQARAAERALLKEKQVPPEGVSPNRSEIELPAPPLPITDTPETADDVEFVVVEWVRSMADGDLGDADRSMMLLQKNKAASKQAVQKVRMIEPPPAGLQDVPRPVLNRYFKMLSDQL